MKWIDPKIKKPEGEVFWALTEGRNEQGHRDWVIRKLLNDEHGDYRSLDISESFRLPGTFIGQHWCMTIWAWLPIEEITVDSKINW